MSTPTVETSPDTISVTIQGEREMLATHSDLWVIVQGSSLVTGDAALNKAREVANLVADLRGVGVAEADIKLEGVRAETTSGMLTRSSSATYTLRVRCRDLSRLADVLGAITGQKNASLRTTLWGYSEDDTHRNALLGECLQRASDKAQRIARGLGVTLTGVHRFTESFQDGESPPLAQFAFERAKAPGAAVQRLSQEDLGMDVSHSKRITLRIDVEYRVSGFRLPAPAGTP